MERWLVSDGDVDDARSRLLSPSLDPSSLKKILTTLLFIRKLVLIILVNNSVK